MRLEFRRTGALLIVLSEFCCGIPSASSTPIIPYSKDDYILTSFSGGQEGQSKVVVDLYVDLACIDSSRTWPAFKQTVVQFPSVKFNLRLMPLPYHRASFILSSVATVLKSLDHLALIAFLDDVLGPRQPAIYNDSLSKMTDVDLQSYLWSDWVAQLGVEQLSEDAFAELIQSTEVDFGTRHQFKYGVLHNVHGTPLAFVGGVMADFDLQNASSWEEALAPLVEVHGHDLEDEA
jgi:hypothetical protein